MPFQTIVKYVISTSHGQRRALGHNEVGTKYVTEEGYNGFSRWQIGIGHFRFRNMTLRYYIGSEISLIIYFVA